MAEDEFGLITFNIVPEQFRDSIFLFILRYASAVCLLPLLPFFQSALFVQVLFSLNSDISSSFSLHMTNRVASRSSMRILLPVPCSPIQKPFLAILTHMLTSCPMLRNEWLL